MSGKFINVGDGTAYLPSVEERDALAGSILAQIVALSDTGGERQ